MTIFFLFHGHLSGEEQQLGPLHLLLVDELHGRRAKLPLEQTDEVGLRHAGHVGKFLYVELLLVATDIDEDAVQLYSLTGVRLQEVPQKGFYIVRQGGKTRKMLAK